MHLTLVGASFRARADKDILRASSMGQELTLVPDPENAYDPTAVKVLIDEAHVGFLPRNDAPRIFHALMGGDEVSAVIVAFESALRPVMEIEL